VKVGAVACFPPADARHLVRPDGVRVGSSGSPARAARPPGPARPSLDRGIRCDRGSPPGHGYRHGSIPPHAGGRRRHETSVLAPRGTPPPRLMRAQARRAWAQSRWGAAASQRTSHASPKPPSPATPQTSHPEQRRGAGDGCLHAALGPQPMRLTPHGGHRRDALCQRGRGGAHGGAGGVPPVAELSGVRLHATGSSKLSLV
jgi:hypothetical protein